jgi:hypothetical protein
VKRRVHEIATELTRVLSSWPGVEAVTLGEAASIEVFDPYFVIDLDVYLRGREPPTEQRKRELGNPAAFEVLGHRNADTFLVGDLPVRVQYTEASRIELNLRRAGEGSWVYHRENGTNAFYRVLRSELLHDHGGWYARARASLESFPPSLWDHVKTESRTWVEGSLLDLSAAAARNDDVFFVIAASRFVRSLCAFLFAANRRFEPNGRMVREELVGLVSVPSEFLGRFESFVRQNPPLSADKRREVAELLARSILAL